MSDDFTPRTLPDADEIVGWVWHSNLFINAERLHYYDNLEQDSQTVMQTWREICRAEAPAQSKFPTSFYWNEPGKRRKTPGHLTSCTFYVVSAEAAEVFRRFDIGRTALYPTRFTEADRETALPGEYFCISFGETKDGVIVERSDVYERYGGIEFPGQANETTFVLRDAALPGCDLWLDSVVGACCFMSERLASALREARIDKAFELTKCPVVKT